MLEHKRILLAAGNSPAVAWFKARYPKTDIDSKLKDGWLPDAVVAVRKSRMGGVDDPVAIVGETLARGSLPVVVIVAGKKDKTGEDIARRAGALGVPEACILFAGEKGITAPDIAKALEDALAGELRPAPLIYYEEEEKKEEPVEANDNIKGVNVPQQLEALPGIRETAACPAVEPAGNVDWSPLAPYKDRIVPFLSPCAGVGKTTLAAALAAHITSQGGQAAVIDLETPPMVRLHLGNTTLEREGSWQHTVTPWGALWVPEKHDLAGIAALLGQLVRDGYRVIIDAPYLRVPWDNFARQVYVVGGDLRALYACQGQENLNDAILVANRVPVAALSIWPSVVEDVLGKVPEVVIAEDQEGCQATVAGMAPAIVPPGSESIAAGIGALVALLWPEGGSAGAPV
ncbi:hypothetical protein MGLY_35510 (plasmid) [Neomoorella glycerini]|uniref:CobQ/CobB/MinD/ParA nucleotide binding domain-containing protein n=1 Tax=Neomoorella glycerini TaxID=55779 RepID=A0A6I5ZWI4_9FIRM|nr:cellulose synthase operon protein YhjQ/BcsQ [Moorella glycerini]QGP94126.1 hypothetical protein MGLY_35510 [Moorella glycerini]